MSIRNDFHCNRKFLYELIVNFYDWHACFVIGEKFSACIAIIAVTNMDIATSVITRSVRNSFV